MAASRRCRLHRQRGSSENDVSLALYWMVAVFAIFLLLALLFGHRLLAIADVAFTLLQAFLVLTMLVAAAVAGWKLRHRRHAAEAAARAAHAGDSFWNPEAFKLLVANLFEPYWRAVGQQNVVGIAEHLSAYWRDAMNSAFAAWRGEHCKPVLFELRFGDACIVGMEDWRDNRRDQITALVACRTAYHLTDMRNGEVVEGQPLERDEKQLWRFVRGERGWLLNRVEIVAGSDAYDACRVVTEASASTH